MSRSFKTKLKNKEFIKCLEILPPKDPDMTPLMNDLKIHRSRFDVVSIVDNPRGIVHISSLAAAHIIKEAGFDVIMHISCTNKNRIEIQSQILGAEALGIKNILFVTGDHVLSGENYAAKPVYDIDSIQAIKLAKNLSNNLFLGAAANQLSGELQLKMILKKLEAGAEFIMTQPVYDIKKFKNFVENLNKINSEYPIHIIAGIMPLRSLKQAEFINNKIPGICIPEKLIGRLQNSKNPRDEGINIANETICEIKEIKGVSGINIMGLFDLNNLNEFDI